MNEAILKSLASGTIGLVIVSALWLAGSVQTNSAGDASTQIYGQAHTTAHARHDANLELVAFPAERAASSPLLARAAIIVR